jgi:hypothetical protein
MEDVEEGREWDWGSGFGEEGERKSRLREPAGMGDA